MKEERLSARDRVLILERRRALDGFSGFIEFNHCDRYQFAHIHSKACSVCGSTDVRVVSSYEQERAREILNGIQ